MTTATRRLVSHAFLHTAWGSETTLLSPDTLPHRPTPGSLRPLSLARQISTSPLEWSPSGNRSGFPAHSLRRPRAAFFLHRARPRPSGWWAGAGVPGCLRFRSSSWGETSSPGKPAARSGPARPVPAPHRLGLRGAPVRANQTPRKLLGGGWRRSVISARPLLQLPSGLCGNPLNAHTVPSALRA